MEDKEVLEGQISQKPSHSPPLSDGSGRFPQCLISPGPGFVIILYAFMAVVFTYPLILYLSTGIIGDQQGDVWKHLWGFWWINHTIATEGYFPLSTVLLDYPYGGSLFFIDPLGAVMSIPLQVFFSPGVSYNLVVLINLILGAWCMQALAFHFTRDRASSILAGTGYAFTAYMLAYLTSGVSETFNIWGIPLFLLFFDRMTRRKGESMVLPAVGAFLVATLGSWYYGITCVLFGGLLYACRIISRTISTKKQSTASQPTPHTSMMETVEQAFPHRVDRETKVIIRREPLSGNDTAKELSRKPTPATAGAILAGILVLIPLILSLAGRGDSLGRWAMVTVIGAVVTATTGLLLKLSRRQSSIRRDSLLPSLIRLGAFCLVTGILVLPMYVTFRMTINEPSGMVQRQRTAEYIRLYLSEGFHNVSRLADYLRPGKNRADRTYTVDRLTRSSYGGWILMILALAGFVTARRKPWFGFFATGAFLFVMLSLGPFLYLDWGIGLEKPFFFYMWLYKYLPFFDQVSIPYRFNLPAMLCISMMATYGLSAISHRFNPRCRTLAVIIISLTVLTEVILISPGPYPVPISELATPQIYQKMALDQEYYGIIDLPIQRGKGELSCGEYFYYQTTHQKGIPYTVEGTIPRYIYQNPFTLALYRLERGIPFPHSHQDLLSRHKDHLRQMRFRYIVVHDNYLSPAQRARIHPFLEYFLGPSKDGGSGLKVYSINPVQR